jgi:hypothetical protein
MANKFTFGEMLFAEYLTSQNIKFEHEPELPGIRQLFDFVIDHPEADKILLDVKDIENAPMPKRSGAFSPYTPIRSHIEAGKKKFKYAKDYLCALVLVAPPISLAMLESPVVHAGGNVWQSRLHSTSRSGYRRSSSRSDTSRIFSWRWPDVAQKPRSEYTNRSADYCP